MKEPFYLSVRFWVAVLTTPVSLLLTYIVQHVPFLQVDQTMATEFFASMIVLGITYVIARTVRNSRHTS